jgi:hypothetical protein
MMTGHTQMRNQLKKRSAISRVRIILVITGLALFISLKLKLVFVEKETFVCELRVCFVPFHLSFRNCGKQIEQLDWSNNIIHHETERAVQIEEFRLEVETQKCDK